MKRLILLFVLVATAATQSFGRAFEKYTDIDFTWMSPNAEYLVSYYAGEIYIYHRPDSTLYKYVGNETSTFYDLGQGNSVNDLGMVVGSMYYRKPAYWQNGSWKALPLRDDIEEKTYSMAMGVSADGNTICGMINVNFGSTTQVNIIPCVWTRQENGEFGEYEVLPFPEKDFAGRVTRDATTLYVSADGKMITGHVKCPTLSLLNYPIVYTKDDEGNWSYKLYGLDCIYDTSVEFPTYPTYKPTYPAIDYYMTEEDDANWQEAVDNWRAGLTDDPSASGYPKKIDYCSYADAYNADLATYEEEYALYSDSLSAFNEIYNKALTGGNFRLNNTLLSDNGKYMGETLSMPDKAGPVTFDFTNGGAMSEVSNGHGMQATRITDDGMIVGYATTDEAAYMAYVLEKDAAEAVPFEEWIASKDEEALDWMNENMLYDIILYDTTEDGDYNIQSEKDDVLVTGAMITNPEGNRFLTLVYDAWSEDAPNGIYCSFLIDISEDKIVDGIKAARGDAEGDLNITVADGQIKADGMDNIALFDMQGRKMAGSLGSLTANVASGIYLVKGTTANGATVTRKVSVGR